MGKFYDNGEQKLKGWDWFLTVPLNIAHWVFWIWMIKCFVFWILD